MPDPRFTPEPLVDAAGAPWRESVGVADNISGGKYVGPEVGAIHPWKCPKCGVDNVSRFELGCPHCGGGKPGFHVGSTPPSPAQGVDPPAVTHEVDTVGEAFSGWLRAAGQQNQKWAHATENHAILYEAFRAGWIAGAQNQARHTMTAPPVTVDVESLSPEGKPRRTIVAALELFRDQVLSGAADEIASGEWCSIEEVDQLIAQLKEERDG